MAKLSSPRRWGNQHITLYHGTLDIHTASIMKGVDLRYAREDTDFGKGFYTTTLNRQALRWAWQLSGQVDGTKPAIIQFEVNRDELASLDIICFVRGDFEADDFWSLVFHCRTDQDHHGRGKADGWYDLAIGPVAARWKHRVAFSRANGSDFDADQVSFHTPRAVKLLNQSQPKLLSWR